MKNAKILVLSAALILGLAGCDSNSSSTTTSISENTSSEIASSEETVSSEETTSEATSVSEEESSEAVAESSESNPAESSEEQSSSEISSSEATKYAVNVTSTSSVTVTTDKETASKGETVTINVVCADGFKVKDISVTPNVKNGVSVVEANKTYTFVMPNNPVDITVTVDVIATAGTISITGDVAAVLTKEENGIYVARNVSYPASKLNCEATYVVDGENLSCTLIDNYKCFATLGVSGTKGVGFTIAGNATYDFYYDPAADLPCYVIRTKVNELPASEETFSDIWGNDGGNIKSESTSHPQNVKTVDYTNTSTGDVYHFDNYENGSLATSTVTVGEGEEAVVTKSVVYKNIEDNIYTVVDTYIEGSDGLGDTTYEKKGDNTAFSGRYSVVNSYGSGLKNYQYLTADAKFDAHENSHNLLSIDEDIMCAYRVGFDSSWDETLVGYDVSISSVANENGFTTTVESYKNYDDSKDSESGSSDTYRYQYKVVASFDEAGQPLSGSYTEKTFTSAQFDVNTNKFIGANSWDSGTIEKKTTWNYTYGAANEGSATFDTTPYIASSVSATIQNSSVFSEGNKVAPNDCLNDYLNVSVSPATALDGWQYGIISSSNTKIFNNTKDYAIKYVAKGAGTASVKIGNYTTNDVTCDVEVESVNDYTVCGWTLDVAPDSSVYYDDEIDTSTSLYVRSNCSKKVQMVANSRGLKDGTRQSLKVGVLAENTRVVKITSDAKGKTPVEGEVEVSLDNGVWSNKKIAQPGAMVTVATFKSLKSVEAQTNYYIWITCDNIDDYWVDNDDNTVCFTMHVLPYEKPTKGIYGTWSDEADASAGEEVVANLQAYDSTVGQSTYSTIAFDGNTYSFKFTYDEESGAMTSSAVAGLGYIAVVYDSTEDEVGFFLVGESTWSGEDDTTEGDCLLGSGYSDDEGGYVIETYYFLSRVEA